MKKKSDFPCFLPVGDTALVVEFANEISLQTNRRVLALEEEIRKRKPYGIQELVPTYRSLLIRYNPAEADYEQLIKFIASIMKTAKPFPRQKQGQIIAVPVVYGGEYGPDLSYVAQYHGLTPQKVVTLHSQKTYTVYMIGFIAGFPYMGEVDKKIATPRLATPRLKVPAGSVGIAERQTGIYPCEAPGGWQIIGRTPLKLFNPLKNPPALLKPGDLVKFTPIDERQFKLLAQETR